RLAKIMYVTLMASSKALWDKLVERFTDGVLGRVKKHSFSRCIKEHDALLFVDGDNRVHRRANHSGKLLLALPQVLFSLFTLGDVHNRSQDHHPLFGLQRIQTDLDRKLAAILPQAVEITTGAHGPRRGIGDEAVAISRMMRVETLRHEHFDRLSQQLVAVVIK